MLNETLYECLVELGIADMKARKAASEDARLERLCEDMNEMRLTMAQVLRQTAQINDRLIDNEAITKVLLGRMDKQEQRQDRLEKDVGTLTQDVGVLKQDVGEIKEMMKTVISAMSKE